MHAEQPGGIARGSAYNDSTEEALTEKPTEESASPDEAAQDGDGSGSSTSNEPRFEESLADELGALIDDGRVYAEAELRFQKTRAALVGRYAGVALACVVLAVILVHIAFLALAVGLVIALAPHVTIWGAIAIVVGALLALVVLLGLKAKGRAERLAALFAAPSAEDTP